jgi:hypothetical protein
VPEVEGGAGAGSFDAQAAKVIPTMARARSLMSFMCIRYGFGLQSLG